MCVGVLLWAAISVLPIIKSGYVNHSYLVISATASASVPTTSLHFYLLPGTHKAKKLDEEKNHPNTGRSHDVHKITVIG